MRREKAKGVGMDKEDATLVASSSWFTALMFGIGRLVAAVGSGARRTGGRFTGRMNTEPDDRSAAGEADDARTSFRRLAMTAGADDEGSRGAEAEAPMSAVAADTEVEADWSGRAVCGLSKCVLALVAGTMVGIPVATRENGERGRGTRGWREGALLGRRRYLARLEEKEHKESEKSS